MEIYNEETIESGIEILKKAIQLYCKPEEK